MIESTPSTLANVRRFLEWRGLTLDGCEIHETPFIDVNDPSRVYLTGPGCTVLLDHCEADPEFWRKGSGANHDKFGAKVRFTFRSQTSPSCQLTFVEVLDALNPAFHGWRIEADLDYQSPNVNPFGHALEVAWNGLGHTTDPEKVHDMLNELMRKEEKING